MGLCDIVLDTAGKGQPAHRGHEYFLNKQGKRDSAERHGNGLENLQTKEHHFQPCSADLTRFHQRSLYLGAAPSLDQVPLPRSGKRALTVGT